MPTSVTVLKSARLFHLYSGVFLAPALCFFAITGGLQTFSFHETTKGSNYKPPAILVELGQLHKKQTIIVPQRKPSAPETKPTPTPAPTAIDSVHHQDFTNQQKHDRLAETTPAAVAPIPSPSSASLPATPAATPQKQKNLLPMKIFFLITSIGLFLSTLTGLFMAYKYARRATPITLTLLAGIAIPLLLLLF